MNLMRRTITSTEYRPAYCCCFVCDADDEPPHTHHIPPSMEAEKINRFFFVAVMLQNFHWDDVVLHFPLYVHTNFWNFGKTFTKNVKFVFMKNQFLSPPAPLHIISIQLDYCCWWYDFHCRSERAAFCRVCNITICAICSGVDSDSEAWNPLDAYTHAHVQYNSINLLWKLSEIHSAHSTRPRLAWMAEHNFSIILATLRKYN